MTILSALTVLRWSEGDLARACEVSVSTVRRWAHDPRYPPPVAVLAWLERRARDMTNDPMPSKKDRPL